MRMQIREHEHRLFLLPPTTTTTTFITFDTAIQLPLDKGRRPARPAREIHIHVVGDGGAAEDAEQRLRYQAGGRGGLDQWEAEAPG